MLPDFRPFRASRAWRAAYVVCTLLVFSYILFEVLDLDGSSFPLKQYPLDRAAIVAEVAKDTARAYSVEKIQLRGYLSQLLPSLHCQAMRVRLARAVIFSPLNSVRLHGYRVALPRSSPPDP